MTEFNSSRPSSGRRARLLSTGIGLVVLALVAAFALTLTLASCSGTLPVAPAKQPEVPPLPAEIASPMRPFPKPPGAT